MAHEPVEIIGRGSSDVGLIISNLRYGLQIFPHLVREGCGLLKCSALGHINDHLQFTLVVEGKHLDSHHLQRH